MKNPLPVVLSFVLAVFLLSAVATGAFMRRGSSDDTVVPNTNDITQMSDPVFTAFIQQRYDTYTQDSRTIQIDTSTEIVSVVYRATVLEKRRIEYRVDLTYDEAKDSFTVRDAYLVE